LIEKDKNGNNLYSITSVSRESSISDSNSTSSIGKVYHSITEIFRDRYPFKEVFICRLGPAT